jgi:hemolysin activation/secretion protein
MILKSLPCCLVAAALATPALAQTSRDALDPGRLPLQEFRDKVTPAKPPRIVPLPENPLQAPSGAEKITFRISEVRISGMTVYDPDEFRPLWKAYTTKSMSLAEAYALASAITARLRNDGYILSLAYVPAQEITDGVLQIDVLEGFVSAVEVEGTSNLRDEIAALAQPIMAEKPTRLQTVERYLLLMNDLPGTSMEVFFKPSKRERGAATLVLKPSVRKQQFSFSSNNRGSRYFGSLQFDAQAIANTAYASAEQTTLRLSTTSEPDRLQYASVAHSLHVGSEGEKISFQGSASKNRVGYNLKEFGIAGESFSAALVYENPLIRQRKYNLNLSLSLGVRNSASEILDQQLTSETIPGITAGIAGDLYDDFQGYNTFALTVEQGVNLFGSSRNNDPKLSRADGTTNFTKFGIDLSREHFFDPKISVFSGLTAQYSPRSLLGSERFGLGGGTYVRAYDSSEITGDSGVASSLEMRYTDQTRLSWLPTYQAFAFYDAGLVYNCNPAATENKRDGLRAFGAGVRFALGRTFTGAFELTKPVADPVATTGDADPRAFFNISARF